MTIALGQLVREFTQLELLDLQLGVDRICFTSDEVTAVCPVTGQPDFYLVEIELKNSRVTIESKTLKLFFQSLSGIGIFCEDLPGKIMLEILSTIEALFPREPEGELERVFQPLFVVETITVRVVQKARGGITIDAQTSWTFQE